MYKSNFKRYFGFTLVELLVAITIIGILSALTVYGVNGTRKKSRDADRKVDLDMMASGLENYYTVNKSYPYPGSDSCSSIEGFASVNTCLNSLGMIGRNIVDKINVKELVYRYAVIDTNAKYEISAKFENTGDKSLTSDCVKDDTNKCDDDRYEVSNDAKNIDTSSESYTYSEGPPPLKYDTQ